VTTLRRRRAYRNGLAAAERLNEVAEYIEQAGAIAAIDAFIRDALRSRYRDDVRARFEARPW
jgi:hypothetical protein